MRHVHISVHTHSVSHAHFSGTVSVSDVQTSRTRMAPGVCSAHVTSLHLTLSILMFHPPSLLFPGGHFETPSRLRRPRLPCRTVPDPKARVKRTSVRAARRLAAWSIPRTPQFHQLTCKVQLGTVRAQRPKDRLCVCVCFTYRASARQDFLTIRTTITSLTTRKSHVRTLNSSVFP